MDASLQKRLSRVDWAAAGDHLANFGYALTGPLLSAEECRALVSLYSRQELFRSQVIMEKHRFGRGDYKYFHYPLPPLVGQLREASYPYLAEIANLWQKQLGLPADFPPEHESFLQTCRAAGQKLATPLILHYRQGGYNCLHQDLYGQVAFPLQLVVLLGQVGRDWQGGEFVLVENVPRAQSRALVVNPDQGHGIVFTTRHRPVEGARGFYRVATKHGVSRVESGVRFTLGIIYHDAK
jgi:uncharacterized protein